MVRRVVSFPVSHPIVAECGREKSCSVREVRVNVVNAHPMGPGRLFITLLISVVQTARLPSSVLSAHKPEMRRTGLSVLKLDTGGERQLSNPRLNRH